VSVLAGEILAFQADLRRRSAERIEPLIAGIDESQAFSARLWEELRATGIFELPFGAPGSFPTFIVATEEIARAGAIAGLYPGTTVQVAATLLRHGRAEQQERWLPALTSGTGPAAWAFTEPQTGSDPRQITTRAQRAAGGDWILDGQKAFISFARQALVTLVFAQTDAGRLGAFLVPAGTPGVSHGAPVRLMSFGGGEPCAVYLDQVRLPAEALVGEPGAGFGVLLAGEAEGKVRASAINVGIAQRAVDEAASYAMTRTHRGTPIATKFPTVAARIGEMEAQVRGARAHVRAVAAELDGRAGLGVGARQSGGAARSSGGAAGPSDEAAGPSGGAAGPSGGAAGPSGGGELGAASAAVRITTGRCAREVTSDALQICGAYGWTKELPVERLYREAKFFEVTQGVIDIQRAIVARHVLAAQRGTAARG
jgi:alkylation response protein AidB-like acyl-CoA dehydrogenase